MSKVTDSRNFDTVDPAPISFDSAHESTVITEGVGGAMNKGYLEELAFMEEMVTVTVMESSNINDEDPVPAGNNGQFVYFKRGVQTNCKRKFLDSLIVKGHSVSTPFTRNPSTGEEGRLIKLTNSSKYPFQVIEDKNPKGKEWLRRRMAETV